MVLGSFACGGALGGASAMQWPSSAVSLWAWVALATIILASSALAWIVPVCAHRGLAWRLDDNMLWIESGLCWRRQYAIPRNRIQYLTIKRGLIERRYELATLVIHTAGTISAEIELPGLELGLAHKLRGQLLLS